MSMDLSGFVRKKATVEIGSKKFIFTELDMADLAAFKNYLIEQKKKANQEHRERLVTDAKKIGDIDPMELLKLTDSSISEEEFEEQLGTVEGLSYLVYLSLRYAYPEVSREDATHIMTPSNSDAILEIMFPETKGDKKGEVKKKLTPKRKSPK